MNLRELSTQAAMAVWCRHRLSRRAARAVPGLVEAAARLGARGAYCEYIAELLQAADGMLLTVLAPEQRLYGARFTYRFGRRD